MEGRQQKERGQAIVIMAFAILALGAIVGLAIDGGRLYALRRQAQNAADAAALAATRELALLISQCASGSSSDNTRVNQGLLEYARLNNVEYGQPNSDIEAWYVDENGDPLYGSAGTIPTGATGVAARATLTDTTTFIRLVGQRFIVATGEATAMTGPVTQLGGGILPIAVPLRVVQELGEGDIFTMKDDDGAFCRDPDMIDTCVGYDGEGGIEGNSQRGWINLSYVYNQKYWNASKPPNRVFSTNSGNNGCSWNGDVVDVGGTGLKGWASGDCPYPHMVIAGAEGSLHGDYITGLGGSRPNAIEEIRNGFGEGVLVYAPVFDYIYSKDDMNTGATFASKTPDIGWIGGNYYYYHIVGFVGVYIHRADKQDKIIEANFQDLITGDGAIVPSAGLGNVVCYRPDVFGVKLWD